MTSRYKILFAVDLLNDYYTDGRCIDFTIIPSSETALLLKRYQLLYKLTANKLVVITKVDNSTMPLTGIGAAGKFVFYLDLQRPVFINYTNIDLNALTNKRFYFTNLNQNKSGSILNITQKIPDYEDSTAYLPGGFADDRTGEIFECLQSTTGHNTTTEFWASRGQTQFVSTADMITPSTKIFNYTAPAARTEFEINIFTLNKTTNTYTDIAKAETQNFSEATQNIQVNFSSLKAGKYRVTINVEEIFLYVDDDFVYSGYFGVIEIFAHLPNTNDFAFFDNATGSVKEITYTIHFANRRAFWKYISARNKINNIKIKDTEPPQTPFRAFSTDPAHPGRKDFFVSDEQLLISEKTDENNFELMLNAPLQSLNPAASKPDLNISGMLTKQDENFFCNIYLNF